MSPEVAIEAERLGRSFGGKPALVDLDLRVHRGEVLGLLGHNGAGKTTAVRLFGGVLTPSSGRVRVLGFEPLRDGVALRRRTGVLTETPSVDERLTGRQGLRFFAELYDVSPAMVNARVDALLEGFELVEAADRRVATYSKGMRQRLALARALLHEPELLFLDEPSSGLDPVAAKAVDERIAALREGGTTVVLCTHNLAQAESLCDRVVVLEQGRVVASGAPAALAAELGAPLRVVVRSDAATLIDPVRLLGGVPGVADVSQQRANGGGAQFSFVAADEATIASVARALVAAGVAIYALEPERPSLEQVYFALHRGDDASERGSA